MMTLAACRDTDPKTVAVATVIRTEKPTYAKGFELQELSDSTTRIVLFNLEKPGDTLQLITWKKTKITSMACVSTTHIAIIDLLNRLTDVKGVGFADLVQNTHARALIENGSMLNLSIGHDTDDEIVYSIHPQLLFVYPFGGNNYDKYLKKGIGCVQISEYLETHPLGRAEWLKVFGVLLNEEEKADSIFNQVEHEYLALKKKVDDSVTQRPTAFTGFYDSGSWFAPPGNSFAAQFINDAGAHYIFSDSLRTGNIVLPFETLFEKAYNADYWGKIMFEPGVLTAEKIIEDDPRLAQLKSFRERNIFYCNVAETDYHGDAVVQPQVMLADMIHIFHPEILPDHAPKYFFSIK